MIAFHQCRQARQVSVVQRAFAADGQADAVQRQRIVLADQPQVVVERSAGHHVVFGVDLKKTNVGQGGEHLLEVLALEPQPGPARKAGSRSLGDIRQG